MIDGRGYQSEHVVHTKCQVEGKVAILVVDTGSYTNVASTYLVENLNLPILEHPKIHD